MYIELFLLFQWNLLRLIAVQNPQSRDVIIENEKSKETILFLSPASLTFVQRKPSFVK